MFTKIYKVIVAKKRVKVEINFKNGLKKIKFYDRLLWISSISFLVAIIVSNFSVKPLFNFMFWIFFIFLLVFVSSFLMFYFGMLYWMVLTKNFLLLVLSIFMGFVTILFYFGRMRRKYFKEGKI